MNIFKRIGQAIQIVVGGVSQGRVIVKGVTANSGALRPKQGEEWLHAYNSMPWLRANVAKIAQGVASLEWGITRTMDVHGMTVKRADIQKGNAEYRRKALAAMEEEGKAEAVFDHPFLTLWKNPCPALPGGAARKLAQVYYETVGEVFFVVDRGPRDGWIKSTFTGRPLPTALWPVPPHWVKRFPTPDQPTFEIRHLGLQLNDIPLSEVLWLKDPDPVNPYGRGVGLFNVLSDELDSDENAAKMISYSFYNRNRPDVLVSIPNASDLELQAFRNEWIANLQGVQNTLKSHFVNVEAEVQQIGYDFREMQVIDLRRHTRDTIRQVPGMPPEILGIQDQSNRSTIDAAEFIFNRHVIEPRAEVWREFLSTHVLSEYDPRAVLDYVSPVQEDKNFTLNVVTSRPEVVRVNEVRKLGGLPGLTPEEGGEMFYVNGSFVPSLLTAPPAPGTPGGAPAGPGTGLSLPGFEGGINVPGAPQMHLHVPGAMDSPAAGTAKPPAGPPQAPQNPAPAGNGPGFTLPSKGVTREKGAAAGAARRFRDGAVSPDASILISKWAKLNDHEIDFELLAKEAPIPLSDDRGTEWARRAIAFLNERSTKGWDRMFGPWSKGDEEILDSILLDKAFDPDQPRDDAGRFAAVGGEHTVIPGKFLNEGKVSVRLPSGVSSGFHATEAEARADADRLEAVRIASNRRSADDRKQIEAALGTTREPTRDDVAAFASVLGASKPTASMVTHFIRIRYGTTIQEARRHATRIVNGPEGFTDASGTQRAAISDMIKYLRSRAGEIKPKTPAKKAVRLIEIRKHLPGQHDQQSHNPHGEGGGEPTMDKPERDALFRKLSEPGAGFTVHAVSKASPKDGFMVSPYPDRSFNVPIHRLTPRDIARFVKKNRDLLSKPDHFLGGWHDKGESGVWLDISVRSSTREEARALAKEHGQIAYFNLAEGREERPEEDDGRKSGAVHARRRAERGRDRRAVPGPDGTRADRAGDDGSPRRAGLIEKHLRGTEFEHDESTHGSGGGGGERDGAHTVASKIIAEKTTKVPNPPPFDPDVEKDATGDGVTESARVGVPAHEVPPPPAVPRLPNLTAHERQAESEFADAYERDPDKMARQFLDMVKGDPPPKFEADAAKNLYGAWKGEGFSEEERAEIRSTLNTALHQTADAIAKRAFLMHLDEMGDADKAKGLLVTVGGVGAGKGFALKTLAKEGFVDFNSKNYGAVWDSAGDQNATENPWLLEEATKRGIGVTYAYVSADPEVSWADPARGVVQRAKDPRDGRMVDAKVFADSYTIGARNHAAFFKANESKARFVFVRNGAKIEKLDGVPDEDVKRDRRKLHDFAVETVSRLGEEIPPRIRRGALVGQRIWPSGRFNRRKP